MSITRWRYIRTMRYLTLYSPSERSFGISIKHYMLQIPISIPVSQRDACQACSSPMRNVWHVTPEENDYRSRRSGLRRQFDGRKITQCRTFKEPILPGNMSSCVEDTDVVFRVLYERAFLLTSSKRVYIPWPNSHFNSQDQAHKFARSGIRFGERSRSASQDMLIIGNEETFTRISNSIRENQHLLHVRLRISSTFPLERSVFGTLC